MVLLGRSSRASAKRTRKQHTEHAQHTQEQKSAPTKSEQGDAAGELEGPRHPAHGWLKGQHALGFALAFASVLGLVLTSVASTAGAAVLGLRQVGTGATTINAGPGQNVSLEIFLDTGGLTLEGYYVGVDIDRQGGTISGLSLTHQALPGLFPDLFGAPVIDDAAGTIRDSNQTTFTTGLAPGIYVLDIISLTVDAYGPIDEMLLTPGLFGGQVLGLGGGSCPGTTAGCSVTTQSASIVPEPGTALLMGLGLMGLGVSGRGPARRRSASLQRNASDPIHTVLDGVS
jgi:hypothetical protein